MIKFEGVLSGVFQNVLVCPTGRLPSMPSLWVNIKPCISVLFNCFALIAVCWEIGTIGGSIHEVHSMNQLNFDPYVK